MTAGCPAAEPPSSVSTPTHVCSTTIVEASLSQVCSVYRPHRAPGCWTASQRRGRTQRRRWCARALCSRSRQCATTWARPRSPSCCRCWTRCCPTMQTRYWSSTSELLYVVLPHCHLVHSLCLTFSGHGSFLHVRACSWRCCSMKCDQVPYMLLCRRRLCERLQSRRARRSSRC